VHLTWYGPDGEDVSTNESGRIVVGVREGTYRVVAEDASGRRGEESVQVETVLTSAAVITGYRVSDASSGSARDGSVEAVGHNLPLGKCSFLWTHGTQTDAPILRDIPTGTYAVTVVAPAPTTAEGEGDADAPLPSVHLCAPARVGVKPR
jgi:hypothetical protein